LTSTAGASSKLTESSSSHVTAVPREAASETLAFRCFWLLLIYTFVRSLFAAAAKPLWYDEMYTVFVSHQPSWKAVWNALIVTRDGNPPGFYFIERIFSSLLANEQISYRLASILGFCCVLVCIFLVIRATDGSLRALICSAPLLLTLLFRPYAVEARTYCVVAACVAFAVLCYQNAPRWPWMVLLAASFMAAESMHYLAFFGFIPFGVAELAILVRARKIRWSVWLALAAGLVPVVALWPLASAMRRFYGTHIWSPPSLFGLANMYYLLFKIFAPLALAILAVTAILVLASTPPKNKISSQQFLSEVGRRWAAIAFLGIPAYLYVFTKVMHGVYVERYALLTVLGIPLCAAFVLRLLPRKGVAVAGAIVLIALLLQEMFLLPNAVRAARSFAPPSNAIESFVARVGHPDLRVVISDGLDYFPLAHYSRDASRFVFLVDPPQAAAYTGSDIVDLQLGTLRCCRPFQIYEFNDFAPRHPSFLLYSNGSEFDWWPKRLLDDGDSLQLLAVDQNRRVYLVKMKPGDSQ
jgi:hypothetical protein